MAQPPVPPAPPAPKAAAPRTDRLVEFKKRFRSYNAGEQAGFAPSFADDLIRMGVAFDPAATRHAVRK